MLKIFLTRDFEMFDLSERDISKGISQVHPIPKELFYHQNSVLQSSEQKQINIIHMTLKSLFVD